MHNYQSDRYTSQTIDGPNCLNGNWNYGGECTYEGQMVWVWNPDINEMDTGYCAITDCYEYEQESAYDPYTIFRGNVTKITSYADANNPNPTQAVVSTKKYDITGNIVEETAACCEQKTYTYSDVNKYAYPISFSRGTADNSLRVTTSSTYDFNTGLVLTSTDPNGKTESTSYDANTLRPGIVTSSTGAYSVTGYYDNNMEIIQEVHEAGGAMAGNT